MSSYIMCKKRSNQPLIHVLICERKCKEKDACKEYNRYLTLLKLSETKVTT